MLKIYYTYIAIVELFTTLYWGLVIRTDFPDNETLGGLNNRNLTFRLTRPAKLTKFVGKKLPQLTITTVAIFEIALLE